MEIIDDSIQVLKRNKSRTILTGLSVAGGVFILLLAMSGFSIVRNGNLGEFSKIKTETLFVETLPTTKPYSGFSSGREWTMHKKDIDAIYREFGSSSVFAGPVYFFQKEKNVQLDNGRKEAAPVLATHPQAMESTFLSMVYGRFINKMDMDRQDKVCVVGKKLCEKWFGKAVNPCGQKIFIEGVSYTIIGVPKKDNTLYPIFGNEEDLILIPYTTADAVYNLKGELTKMVFSIPATTGFRDKQEQILGVIRKSNSVDPTDKESTLYEGLRSYAEMITTVFDGTDALFWIVFLGVVITSLLGVLGIMLLSVKERKAEIGIRLTMGAVPEDIEKQFICESLIVTSISSLIGLLGAEIIMSLLRKVITSGVLNNPSFGVPQLPVGGTIFVLLLILVGSVLAGYIPSKKAATLPISELFNDSN